MPYISVWLTIKMLTFFQTDASPTSLNFSPNYTSVGSDSTSVTGVKAIENGGGGDRG